MARRHAPPFNTAARESKSMASATQYYLRKDVFFCTDQGHLFFLDLKKDKYLSIPRKQTILFQDFFRRLPLPTEEEGNPADSLSPDVIVRLSRNLADSGILTTTPSDGKKAVETHWPTASADLIEGDNRERPAASAAAVVRFLAASTAASAKLRWQTLDRTVRSVQARRQRRNPADGPPRRARVKHLVQTFQALRPIYPRKYLCLFDSLALSGFLSFYDVYPRWVFGVTAEPFHAHCWLEDDGLVYNDQLDRVRQYKAIMVV